MNTFRHKLSDETVSQITRFATLHKLDDLDAYKEAWDNWCDSNDDLIERETRRLRENSYEGDVVYKMYKAGRYYFRTKSTEPVDVAKRRKYVSVSKVLIKTIDEHIIQQHKQSDYTPAKGFEEFCRNNQSILLNEMTNMLKSLDKKSVESKLKKTYKNRYFIISRK